MWWSSVIEGQKDMEQTMELKMTADQLQTFLTKEFPQVQDLFTVEEVEPYKIRLRANLDESHLRPGGTVSGPTMFALADVAVYLATLSMIGPEALAVTTNCSIDFMRKPEANCDLVAEARLLKLGKVLSIGDVLIYSDGKKEPVARANVTYSIPPSSSKF